MAQPVGSANEKVLKVFDTTSSGHQQPPNAAMVMVAITPTLAARSGS